MMTRNGKPLSRKQILNRIDKELARLEERYGNNEKFYGTFTVKVRGEDKVSLLSLGYSDDSDWASDLAPLVMSMARI